jgi:tRNA (mo5U34)-methyltransferase
MEYRQILFNELLKKVNKQDIKRVLEIGPKDGADSLRIQSLNPEEIIFLDLPEKRNDSDSWLNNITSKHIYITGNLLYLKEIETLGKFDLIYCTGVLYHNTEQLRLLKKVYDLISDNGFLVLETATLRTTDPDIRNGNYIEVFYPETYRNTGTITHLPTASVVHTYLNMVGFSEVHRINCYKVEPHLYEHRAAFIVQKKSSDCEGLYYHLNAQNDKYILGKSY